MTLPAGLTYVTVTGQVMAGTDRQVAFKTPSWLIGLPFVRPFGVQAVIETDGSFSVELPATDDPAWEPTGWTYQVTVKVDGQTFTGSLAVPIATVGELPLAPSVIPDEPFDPGTVAYILASARSAAGGVAGLDADGDVINAAGEKVTGGEAATVAWNDVTGKPPAFTPATHAASHADGGADEISIDGSQVTSGTVAIGRLPTGTGGSQVALGNHSHGGGGGSAITVKRANVTAVGNITPQATTPWAVFTNAPTISLAAAVGDYVSLELQQMLLAPGSGFFDLAVINGGSIVRYAATGTSTPNSEGNPALYPQPSTYRHYGPAFDLVAESGDLNGGSITFGFAVRVGGTGTLYASSGYPLRWRIVNYGAITVT